MARALTVDLDRPDFVGARHDAWRWLPDSQLQPCSMGLSGALEPSPLEGVAIMMWRLGHVPLSHGRGRHGQPGIDLVVIQLS